MKITIESENFKEEPIGAIAFNLGKSVEEVIKQKLYQESIDNSSLKSQIFKYRKYLENNYPLLVKGYDENFSIISTTKGNV